jgi:hypothetical protein
MKRFSRIAALVLLIGVSVGLASAQVSLTQTTINADQGIGPASLAGGGQSNLQTTISLASATGITQAFNGQPVTFVYVDQELEGILTLQTGTTTVFSVLRAVQGTKAAWHKSGDMALIGTMTPQFGGVAGSGGLELADPPLNGGCTFANTGFTPWVNVITGAQWLCSSVTNTWVPGWNNPLVPGAQKVTTAVASAAGFVTPTGPLFHITGTSAITGFNVPVGFNATAVGGGCFTVIPDAVFSWTAANNIAPASASLNAGTAVVVVNQPITFCWDATNSKFLANTQ